MDTDKKKNKKQMIGIVVSDKMDKTVVVMVERLVKHKFYHKYIRLRSKFAAHDKDNSCKTGDKVLIIESRPYSKTKKWRVGKVLQQAV